MPVVGDGVPARSAGCGRTDRSPPNGVVIGASCVNFRKRGRPQPSVRPGPRGSDEAGSTDDRPSRRGDSPKATWRRLQGLAADRAPCARSVAGVTDGSSDLGDAVRCGSSR
jgi:hypothetical protein